MLLAQAGYGRGEKVHQGLEAELIGGVILSPKDERPERLEQCVADIAGRADDTEVLFDPQFYVATLSIPRDGRLPEYGYYQDHAPLSRNQFSPRQIARYTSACLDYQHNTLQGLTSLISPSVRFDDFRDSWSQIALNMAEAAIDHYSTLNAPHPLLVSVVVSEAALLNESAMGEFLDALSSLEVDGFYVLVIRSSSGYQAALDARAMQHLLYFIHVLAHLNDYRVFVGYSDWLGFLLHAAGASATATGWHQTLRQFSMSRFEPATGGRRPRKRYSSGPMLSSPLIVPELQDIHTLGLLPNVLTGSDYDAILASDPAAGEARWTDEIGCLAHWAAVGSTITHVQQHASPTERANAALELVDRASSLYDQLQHRGVNFEAQTGPDHLAVWRDSLNAFRQTANI